MTEKHVQTKLETHVFKKKTNQKTQNMPISYLQRLLTL